MRKRPRMCIQLNETNKRHWLEQQPNEVDTLCACIEPHLQYNFDPPSSIYYLGIKTQAENAKQLAVFACDSQCQHSLIMD